MRVGSLSGYAALLLVLVGMLTGISLQRGFSADNSEELSQEERLRLETPLQYALIVKRYDEALKAMSQVMDINSISPLTGLTALCLASQDESADAIDMVQPLVQIYLADVAQPDAVGNTPLHYAAHAGNLAVVQFLISNGADVNAANVSGGTPLFAALEKDRSRIAEYLLNFGAKELTAEETKNLNASIVMREAMKHVQESMSTLQDEPEPTIEGFRSRVESGFNEAIESLQTNGKIEELVLVEQFRDNMLRAIDDTPMTDEMSMMEWAKTISIKVGAGIAAVSRKGGLP